MFIGLIKKGSKCGTNTSVYEVILENSTNYFESADQTTPSDVRNLPILAEMAIYSIDLYFGFATSKFLTF